MSTRGAGAAAVTKEGKQSKEQKAARKTVDFNEMNLNDPSTFCHQCGRCGPDAHLKELKCDKDCVAPVLDGKTLTNKTVNKTCSADQVWKPCRGPGAQRPAIYILMNMSTHMWCDTCRANMIDPSTCPIRSGKCDCVSEASEAGRDKVFGKTSQNGERIMCVIARLKRKQAAAAMAMFPGLKEDNVHETERVSAKIKLPGKSLPRMRGNTGDTGDTEDGAADGEGDDDEHADGEGDEADDAEAEEQEGGDEGDEATAEGGGAPMDEGDDDGDAAAAGSGSDSASGSGSRGSHTAAAEATEGDEETEDDFDGAPAKPKPKRGEKKKGKNAEGKKAEAKKAAKPAAATTAKSAAAVAKPAVATKPAAAAAKPAEVQEVAAAAAAAVSPVVVVTSSRRRAASIDDGIGDDDVEMSAATQYDAMVANAQANGGAGDGVVHPSLLARDTALALGRFEGAHAGQHAAADSDNDTNDVSEPPGKRRRTDAPDGKEVKHDEAKEVKEEAKAAAAAAAAAPPPSQSQVPARPKAKASAAAPTAPKVAAAAAAPKAATTAAPKPAAAAAAPKAATTAAPKPSTAAAPKAAAASAIAPKGEAKKSTQPTAAATPAPAPTTPAASTPAAAVAPAVGATIPYPAMDIEAPAAATTTAPVAESAAVAAAAAKTKPPQQLSASGKSAFVQASRPAVAAGSGSASSTSAAAARDEDGDVDMNSDAGDGAGSGSGAGMQGLVSDKADEVKSNDPRRVEAMASQALIDILRRRRLKPFQWLLDRVAGKTAETVAQTLRKNDCADEWLIAIANDSDRMIVPDSLVKVVKAVKNLSPIESSVVFDVSSRGLKEAAPLWSSNEFACGRYIESEILSPPQQQPPPHGAKYTVHMRDGKQLESISQFSEDLAIDLDDKEGGRMITGVRAPTILAQTLARTCPEWQLATGSGLLTMARYAEIVSPAGADSPVTSTAPLPTLDVVDPRGTVACSQYSGAAAEVGSLHLFLDCTMDANTAIVHLDASHNVRSHLAARSPSAQHVETFEVDDRRKWDGKLDDALRARGVTVTETLVDKAGVAAFTAPGAILYTKFSKSAAFAASAAAAAGPPAPTVVVHSPSTFIGYDPVSASHLAYEMLRAGEVHRMTGRRGTRMIAQVYTCMASIALLAERLLLQHTAINKAYNWPSLFIAHVVTAVPIVEELLNNTAAARTYVASSARVGKPVTLSAEQVPGLFGVAECHKFCHWCCGELPVGFCLIAKRRASAATAAAAAAGVETKESKDATAAATGAGAGCGSGSGGLIGQKRKRDQMSGGAGSSGSSDIIGVEVICVDCLSKPAVRTTLTARLNGQLDHQPFMHWIVWPNFSEKTITRAIQAIRSSKILLNFLGDPVRA